jgi:ABC-type nitrate/sulfonate/bicarbonate transport system substrate-binding protein
VSAAEIQAQLAQIAETRALLDAASPENVARLTADLAELRQAEEAARREAEERYAAAVPIYEQARDAAVAAIEPLSEAIERAIAARAEVDQAHVRLTELGVEPGPRPARASVLTSREPEVRRVFQRFQVAYKTDF